jgi:nitrate reductase (cytochrome), electron transfer subunit
MKTSKLWIIFVAGLMLAVSPFFSGCQSGAKMDSAPAASVFADTEISLRKDNIQIEAKSLPAPQYSTVEAGESKVLARAFYDAPPMIPHSIENISQSKEDNECLSCHEEGDEETPGIPPSHKIKAVIKMVDRDQSNNGMLHVVASHAKVGEGINNERYYCTACHLPQATNLTQLVGQDFKKETPGDAQLDVLDDLNSFKYD